MQTVEIKDFYRDFVAMSFDLHSSTVVLDMMRSMSYLPGMGLGRCQHEPSEFIAILDHDVPFGLGFIPTKADYRYMVRLRKEMMRARLTHTPFYYLVHPYTMSLIDYFMRASEPHAPFDKIIGGLSTTQEVELQHLVQQLRLSDGALSTSTLALITPSSPDHTSLMTFCFLDEIDDHGTFSEISDIVDGAAPCDKYVDEMLALSLSQIEEIVQPELTSPFDLFGVSFIEIAEDAIAVVDLIDGTVSLVEGVFDFMDSLLSFDVLSGFVSYHDYVFDFSSMDLSIFEYLPISCDIDLSAPPSPTTHIFDIDDEIAQHDSDDDSFSVFDSDPVDKRVSPAVGDTKIVDFGTADQPRELRIGSDLSVDEKDSLI